MDFCCDLNNRISVFSFEFSLEYSLIKNVLRCAVGNLRIAFEREIFNRNTATQELLQNGSDISREVEDTSGISCKSIKRGDLASLENSAADDDVVVVSPDRFRRSIGSIFHVFQYDMAIRSNR